METIGLSELAALACPVLVPRTEYEMFPILVD